MDICNFKSLSRRRLLGRRVNFFTDVNVLSFVDFSFSSKPTETRRNKSSYFINLSSLLGVCGGLVSRTISSWHQPFHRLANFDFQNFIKNIQISYKISTDLGLHVLVLLPHLLGRRHHRRSLDHHLHHNKCP